MVTSSSDSFKIYIPDRLSGVLLDAQRSSSAKRPSALCLTVDPKCNHMAHLMTPLMCWSEPDRGVTSEKGHEDF